MKTFNLLSLLGLSFWGLVFLFSDSAFADETNPCSQNKAEKLQLLKKAEENEYNIKRIEISGNTYTRYRTFRGHWEKNFNEGDIFTQEALLKSIKGINKIKSIKPISLDNIEVRLEENDNRGWNSINFVICVEQKK